MWINFVLWEGRGRRKKECYFWGSPGRRGSFVGKLMLIAAAFVLTFSFLLLWWPVVLQEADGVLILSHSGWGVMCGSLFPLAMKELIPWLQYIAVGKRRLQMTSKTWSLFFQTKTIEGDASSQLSQSIGYTVQGTWFRFGGAGQAARGAEGKRGVKRKVVCKSLFPNM